MTKLLFVLLLLGVIQVLAKGSDKKNVQKILSKDSKPLLHVGVIHVLTKVSDVPKADASEQNIPAQTTTAPQTAPTTKTAPGKKDQQKNPGKQPEYNILTYLADLGYVSKHNNSAFKLTSNKICSKNWKIAIALQASLGM